MNPQDNRGGLTAEIAREKLHYDPDTGVIRWRLINSTIGDVAGTVNMNGYIKINYQMVEYQASRLAWLIYYGEWPELLVDHVDGDKSNNRISNLRQVTKQENCANRGMDRHNKSGIRGVCWDRQRGKWRVRFTKNGEQIVFGFFDSLDEAKECAKKSAEELYGQESAQNSLSRQSYKKPKTERTTLRKVTYRNHSGLLGVSYHKQGRKWFSRMKVKGKVICLGYFDDPLLAAEAYRVAAEKREAEFKKSISP